MDASLDEAALLRERIEETRHDISATVEALAYKTDVRARATDALEAVKDTALAATGIAAAQASDAIAEAVAAPQSTKRRWSLIAGAAVVVLTAVLLLGRRKPA